MIGAYLPFTLINKIVIKLQLFENLVYNKYFNKNSINTNNIGLLYRPIL